MPLYRVQYEKRELLLKFPETGMGFQIVYASDGPKPPTYWLVYATARALRIGLSDPEESQLQSRQVRSEIDEMFSATSLRNVELRTSRLVRQRSVPSSFDEALPIQAGADPLPSALIKISTTAAGQVFYRFSSRFNDPRVHLGTGDWLPGTYGTTATDKPLAPSGFAAVGRYALPYAEPASFVRAICPEPGTPIQIGTVAPSFGQAGGGVEVYFPRGAVHVGDMEMVTELPDE